MPGLYELDLAIFRQINLGWRSPAADVFFLIFSYWGLGQIQIIASLLMLRSRATARFTIPLILSVAVVGLLVAQVAKALIPRERPSNLVFAITQEGWKVSSYVSGHTTTAFSFAVMFLLLTWRTRWWDIGWALLVAAFLTGLSRIYRGVHWPSDVLGGAFAGTLGACLLYLGLQRLGWLDIEPMVKRKRT